MSIQMEAFRDLGHDLKLFSVNVNGFRYGAENGKVEKKKRTSVLELIKILIQWTWPQHPFLLMAKMCFLW